MMSEDYHATRGTASRVKITKSDDSGIVNDHTIEGFAGETHTKVMRVEQFGFAGTPPDGSHAISISMGSRRDFQAIIGGEHADHRPKKLGKGNSAFYNSVGAMMKFLGKKGTLDGLDTLIVTVPSVTFKCGGTTLVVDGSGVTITGGKVTHEGKDIGSDHTHINTQPGAGISGPPA